MKKCICGSELEFLSNGQLLEKIRSEIENDYIFVGDLDHTCVDYKFLDRLCSIMDKDYTYRIKSDEKSDCDGFCDNPEHVCLEFGNVEEFLKW